MTEIWPPLSSDASTLVSLRTCLLNQGGKESGRYFSETLSRSRFLSSRGRRETQAYAQPSHLPHTLVKALRAAMQVVLPDRFAITAREKDSRRIVQVEPPASNSAG